MRSENRETSEGMHSARQQALAGKARGEAEGEAMHAECGSDAFGMGKPHALPMIMRWWWRWRWW